MDDFDQVWEDDMRADALIEQENERRLTDEEWEKYQRLEEEIETKYDEALATFYDKVFESLTAEQRDAIDSGCIEIEIEVVVKNNMTER